MTGGGGGGGVQKKRQRVGSSSRLSTFAGIDSSVSDQTLTEATQKPHHRFSFASSSALSLLNESVATDVILSIHLESSSYLRDTETISTAGSVDQDYAKLYLHSDVLKRSKYFSALLSERWHKELVENSDGSNRVFNLNLKVPAPFGSIDAHLTVLKLLYTNDFSGEINTVSSALIILPVALELLFEDCVKYCVRFLEAVPWTEEEEKKVLSVIPFLSQEEAIELLSRVSPLKSNGLDEMLNGLLLEGFRNHPNIHFTKAFVAKLLRDLSPRDSVKRALSRAFDNHLKVVKDSLEAYSSPDFRGDQNETEAIQRLNLHTALTNGKQLLWILERMLELNVGDYAVKEWSEQAAFTANLQRALRDDAWKNIVPGLPAVVLRCTCKLANTVATGSILITRQVRTKLVKDWLPVLIVAKENASQMLPSHKTLYQELEETFLKIISTLPLVEAQGLLQKCLTFSTRNVEDCPHLVLAFNTWFRRANQPPESGKLQPPESGNLQPPESENLNLNPTQE